MGLEKQHKVYKVGEDPEEKTSVALSKNDFADLVLNDDTFANDFDFSNFTCLFEIIRQIIKENEINNILGEDTVPKK